MHQRDIFGRRVAKGLPPALCHMILWSGVALYVWVEIFTAMRSLSIDSGRLEVISIDPEKPNPVNDGRVVHIVGNLQSSGPAVDSKFGVISGEPAAFLRRQVELRQWKKVGPRRPSKDGFELVWSGKEIDTRTDGAPSEFHNEPMPAFDGAALAPGLRLGGFLLDDPVIAGFDKPLPVPPSRELASQLERAIPGRQAFLAREWIVLNDRQPNVSRYRITDDRVWPAGAFRVKFTIVPMGPFTIVGRQSGNRLRPFESAGGASLLIARAGSHPHQTAFQSAESANRFFHWAVRIVASLWIFGGLHMLMQARERIRGYGPDYYESDGE